MKKLLARIQKLLRDRRTRRLFTRTVSLTAAIVVFVTTYALVLPAITMETEADCGIEAHQHDKSCYEEQLICGLEESEDHHHSSSCYKNVLTCGKEVHTHSEACYHSERAEADPEDHAVVSSKDDTGLGTQPADKAEDWTQDNAQPADEAEDWTQDSAQPADTTEDWAQDNAQSADATEDRAQDADAEFGYDTAAEEFSEEAHTTDEYAPDEFAEENAGVSVMGDSDPALTPQQDIEGADASEDWEAYEDTADAAGQDTMLEEETDIEADTSTESGEDEAAIDNTEIPAEEADQNADDENSEIITDTSEDDAADPMTEEAGEGSEIPEVENAEEIPAVTKDEKETGTTGLQGSSEDTDKSTETDQAAGPASSTAAAPTPENAIGQNSSGQNNTASAETIADTYVPTLEPLSFDRILTNATGIYYHHVEDGEMIEDSTAITDWTKVETDTELGKNDILRVYLAYTIPEGALNATNPTATYRLPSNIHLTDTQIQTINKSENGISSQYMDYNTLSLTDPESHQKYLGAEAVEGTRTPDQKAEDYLKALNAESDKGNFLSNLVDKLLPDNSEDTSEISDNADQATAEYISATVKAEDVYDEDGTYGEKGACLGQDLLFTFTPYTIGKNQHEYDKAGQPTKAGQAVEGWFTFDLNMSQVDMIESAVDTYERETESGAVVESNDNADQAVDDHRMEDEIEQAVETGIDENDDAEETAENKSVATVETVKRREQTAEIVFVEESQDEQGNKIHEISTALTMIEESVIGSHSADDQKEENVEKHEEESGDDTEEQARKDNAAEQEETQETEKSEQYTDGTLTAEGDGYAIEMNYTADAMIPEDAKLNVTEITEESDPEAYKACLEQAKASIAADKADETPEASQTVDKKATRFFDIEIVVVKTDEDGQEVQRKIEPAAPVSVNIQITSSSDFAGDERTAVNDGQMASDPTVLHFADDGVEKIESVTAESTSDENGKDENADTQSDAQVVTEVQFQAESFSVYGVVYKKLSTTVLTASGEAYEITLTYDADAKIPDEAELKVREITTEDEEYKGYYDEASHVALGDAANQGLEDPVVAGARIFDIEIHGDDGKVEPAAPVRVDIRLIGDAADLLSVVHFAENGPEAMSLMEHKIGEMAEGDKAIADADVPVEKSVTDKDGETTEKVVSEISFETDAFSVYEVVSVNDDGSLASTLGNGPFALVTGIANDPGSTTGYPESWGRDYFTIIVNANAMSDTPVKSGNNNVAFVAEGVHAWTDGSGSYVGGEELQVWEFERAPNSNRYYIKKTGTNQYINHHNGNSDSCSLSTQFKTEFTVTRNNDGTISISNNGWYLCNNGNGEWGGRDFRLQRQQIVAGQACSKFRLCKASDDFDSFAARKVSVQNLASSDNFIIYRKFVEDDGSEKLYALASDGTFVRVYDGGDTVYWRETNKNVYWNYLPTGTYYGIFSRDPSTNELVYLNPMDSTGQMITGTASRLTLIGKDEGRYGTSIENWDQKAYDYAGLHVTLDDDGVPHLSTGTRAAGTSDEFLFAVAGAMPGEEAETVDTVDSEALGVHITMYDYGDWTREYNAGDKVAEMSDVVATPRNTAEAYTPHEAHQLVKPYLENNVPSSKTQGAMTALFPSEDVAYSNSYSNNSKVTEYAKTGVTDLFLKSYYEENGMFRYRSEDNFAYLGNNGETSFKVYRQAATPYTTDKSPGHTYYYHGHYMPFNDIDMDQHVGRLMNQYGNEYTDGNIVGELPIGDGRSYENIYGTTGTPNFFTGMKMEATFTQPENGVLENGDDMIFRFTGDDDMWVYIDGVLVLDVGGIHEPLTGSINFRTGEVINPKGSSLYGNNGKTTLKDIFDNVLNNNSTPDNIKQKIREIEWNGNTFADYGNHDFKSFYMERGAGASNLDLQFNLKVTLTDQFTVKKELPEGIDSRFVNQTYRFRATYKDNGVEKPLFAGATRERSGKTEVVCSKVYYKGCTDETTGRPIEPEVDVDEDGYFSLRPDEEVVFKMTDKNIEYTISEVGLDTNLIEQVEVNGQVATVEAGTVTAAYAKIEDRSQMNYKNHPVLQELNIIKHILPELTEEDKTAQFEFRVYLESMVDVDGELIQQLVPYSYGPYYVTKTVEGVKHYFTLTGNNNAPEDKGTEPVVCSTTGRSGSINSIPPEYTVEIRNLAVGTHFYVEERRDNIPAGYTFDHEELREGTYDSAEDIPGIDRIIARDETDHQEFDPETVGKLNKDGGPAVSDIYNRRIKTFIKKQWSDTTGKVYESMGEITALPGARDAVITAELWKKKVAESEEEDETVTVTFMVNTTENELYNQVGEPLVIKKGSALEFSLGARDTSKAETISASTAAEIVRSNAISDPAIEYTNGRKKERWSKYTLSSVDQDTTIYATFDASKVGDDFVGRYIALSEAPGTTAQIIDEKVKNITLNIGNEWNESVAREDGYIYYLKKVEESGLPDNGSYVFNSNPVIVTDDDGNITLSLINTYRERTQMTVRKEWDPELPADQVGSAYAKVELHRYVKKSKGVMDVTLKDELFGIPIAGAVFKLQKLGDDGESYEDVKTLTTDINGVAGVSELDPGFYRFIQQSTPEGFSMNNHTTVTDTFEVVDNTTEKQEKHFELTNTVLRTAGVATLTVTDNHGDPVADAEFTLYDSTGNALEGGRLTDNEGKIVAGPLDAGTYYFEQTGTSDDYKMPGNKRTESFTVVEHPGDPQLFDLSMTNTLKGRGVVTVSLAKEDNNGPIAGATFQLLQGNIEVAAAVTDNGGVAIFEHVYEGDYTVHQVNTDPAYKVDTVDKSAAIAANGEVNQTVDLTVRNKAVGKGTVTVALKTNDTNAPISGARFVLLQGDNLVSDGYTNADGVAVFEDVLEGEYTVQQTSLGSVGNDYKIVEYEYPVTILDNGNANQTVAVDALNYIKGKGTVTVTLTKKDSDEPISGATFQLNQGDAIIQTGETNANGVVVFNNVYEGDYVVHQVDTAEGYVVDADDKNVTIQGNGTANQQVSVTFSNNEDSRTYRVYIHGTEKDYFSDYYNKWYKYYTSGTTVTMKIDLQNLGWITSKEHTVTINGTIVGNFKYNKPFVYTFTVNGDIEIELGEVNNQNASNIWQRVTFSPDSNSTETEYTNSKSNQSVSPSKSVSRKLGVATKSRTQTESNTYTDSGQETGSGNGFDTDTGTDTGSSTHKDSGTGTEGAASGSSVTVARSSEAPTGYMNDAAFKEEYEFNSTKGWSHVFENLDKYDESGNLYYYYVIETESFPSGYTLSGYDVDGNTITVENSKKQGALSITKAVTINGLAPDEVADAVKNKADGTYTFKIYTSDGTTEVTKKADGSDIGTLSITITNGVPDKEITVDKLPPATYIVKETGSNNSETIVDTTATGYDVSKGGISVEVTAGNTNGIQVAAFTNKYIGYDVTIVKVDTGQTSKTLNGAIFDLYEEKYVNQNGTLKDGAVAIKAGLETAGTGEEKGKVSLGTLTSGSYYLFETKAPDGYNQLTEPVKIIINSGTVSLMQWETQKNGTIIENYKTELTVMNTSGVELPHTGGPGTHMFYLIGALLTMLGAGMIMLRNPKT